MRTTSETIILLDAVRRERERRLCESSLMEFTKRAFPIIEPGIKFKDNWHLHAIAEHLEAVTRGEIDDLLINVPPGTMKSILVSVAWPAWEWTMNQSLRYLGASYGEDLAIRDASKCYDVVTSEWYQSLWPEVKVRVGEDQKRKYALTGGGWRMATSVGGRGTGEHPDRKIVDDPHNAKQAESDAERESALEWFDRTLSTRGQSRGAKTVVVMRRLHEQDISGHILADIGTYTHLCIRMEYDGNRRVTTIGWKDPRSVVGALLWPELFPPNTVRKMKTLLGAYGSSGQLQQDPTPQEGGILNTQCFRMWPKDRPLPQFQYIIQSYDCAFTEHTHGDPTACTVWGVFNWEMKRCVMLLDAWDEHLSYPELRKKAIREFNTEYGYIQKGGNITKPRKTDRVLVEAKASGQSLIQDLRAAKIPVQSYDPNKSDKIARAHQTAPILEMEIIWIPESSKMPGEFVSWAQPFVNQVKKFPKAEHDDYVDTFTQAMIYYRDGQWFEMEESKRKDEEDYVPPRKHVNPYAV